MTSRFPYLHGGSSSQESTLFLKALGVSLGVAHCLFALSSLPSTAISWTPQLKLAIAVPAERNLVCHPCRQLMTCRSAEPESSRSSTTQLQAEDASDMRLIKLRKV